MTQGSQGGKHITMDIRQALAKEFPALAPGQIENVEKLLDEGNTIPFIARYRKEQHGGLDDQVLRELAEEKNCPYLDVAEAVTGEDGCLLPELTSDGVHLNTKGCAVWRDYLMNHPVTKTL